MTNIPLGHKVSFGGSEYLLYGRAQTVRGLNRHRQNLRNVGEREGRDFRVTATDGTYYVWRLAHLGPIILKKLLKL